MSEALSLTYATLPLPDSAELPRLSSRTYNPEEGNTISSSELAVSLGLEAHAALSSDDLADALNLEGDLPLRSSTLANALILSDKYLAYVIKHDINHWLEHKAKLVYDDEPSEDEFVFGVTEGYALLIDTFTSTKFLRSGYTELQDYLYFMNDIGELP